MKRKKVKELIKDMRDIHIYHGSETLGHDTGKGIE